jgi:hypothetical protein
MKFEATVESNGGEAITKAKALVMALKGEVQYWYANIPKGHITSWFQLRNKLLSSFKGMQVEDLDSNDLVNMCIQGDRELLTVNSCIKVRLYLQADKSPVVVKGPLFPRVVNPRYRIRGTMCNARIQSTKAR